MTEIERQEKRPSCGWPVAQQAGGTKPCGSEERIFNVTGKGLYTGRTRETPVCEKHLVEAWKQWNVDSANPF
jgi:hypothetical protein